MSIDENDAENEETLPEVPQQPHSTPTQEQLAERCLKLESYCRDLIETNKVLDAENRLAIAQIVHLTDVNQLSNFKAALRFVSQNPKTIYDVQPKAQRQKPFAAGARGNSQTKKRQQTNPTMSNNKWPTNYN